MGCGMDNGKWKGQAGHKDYKVCSLAEGKALERVCNMTCSVPTLPPVPSRLISFFFSEGGYVT